MHLAPGMKNIKATTHTKLRQTSDGNNSSAWTKDPLLVTTPSDYRI